MALQLGFNDSIKLLDSDDDSIRQVLSLTARKYDGYVRSIDIGESDKATYWRIVFSILTVHSPLDASFEAYRAVRVWRARFGRIPSQRKLASLLLGAKGNDGVVQYAPTKAGYIVQFDKDWSTDKAKFTRNGDDDIAWRTRIQANVKGLGLAKASFAVALSAPATSNVCCIDTHMYALLTGNGPAKSAIGKRLYLELEQRVRTWAAEFGLSTFACQWALWDAKRGVSNPHTILGTL